jgi:hypothetical protein
VNDSNLIPNTERSPEELREMGRKGGIKSGESRRRKKRQREIMKLLAENFSKSEECKRLLEFMKRTLQ